MPKYQSYKFMGAGIKPCKAPGKHRGRWYVVLPAGWLVNHTQNPSRWERLLSRASSVTEGAGTYVHWGLTIPIPSHFRTLADAKQAVRDRLTDK